MKYALWAPGIGYLQRSEYVVFGDDRCSFDLKKAKLFDGRAAVSALIDGAMDLYMGVEVRRIEEQFVPPLPPPPPKLIDVGAL